MKTIARMAVSFCAVILLSGQGRAEPNDSQIILRALDDNHTRMVRAFVDRDADAFASCWTPDAVCAIENLPLIRGEDQLRTVFLDAVGGSSMNGLERLNRQIWLSGDYLYETGVYVHRYALTGREKVDSTAMTYVTVWEKQPDGSWKRAAEAWNKRDIPTQEQLAEWRKKPPVEISLADLDETSSGPATNIDDVITHITELEKTFHDYFLTDDVEPAIEMYADSAQLLGAGEKDWCVGKEQIRGKILNDTKQGKLVGIQRDTVVSGGDGQMVYIVNRFRWQLKLPPTGEQVHDFYGKGLHVWQRQPDGTWKILIDINNSNPQPGSEPQ